MPEGQWAERRRTPRSSVGSSSTTKERIRLTGPEATAIPMVFLKAADAKSANPILGDPFAQTILDRYDPDEAGKQFFSTWADLRNVAYIAGRAKQLDEWCQVSAGFIS